jgi:hypothetical protein
MLYDIENNKQLLFLHIPKTAGTSITAWLDLNFKRIHISSTADHPHLSLSTLKEATTKSFISFTVIRNPWDRAVSAYFYFKSRLGDVTFDEFVSNITDFSNRIPDNMLLRNQTEWIDSYIDHILKFENLENDFSVIQNYINNHDFLPRENIRNQSNALENLPYQKYYTNTTRKMIEDIYKRDILKFGYTFND